MRKISQIALLTLLPCFLSVSRGLTSSLPVIVYDKVELRLFEEPIFHGRRELAMELVPRLDELPEIKFYEDLYGGSPESIRIVEVKSSKRKIFHVLYNNVYYGEYLDRTLHEDRGFHHDESIRLTPADIARLAKRPGPENWELGQRLIYTQSVTDFIRNQRKVIETRMKQRTCRYKMDGSLEILSDWQTHNVRKCEVEVLVIDRRAQRPSAPLAVASYYLVPEFISSQYPVEAQLADPLGKMLRVGVKPVTEGKSKATLRFSESRPVAKLVVTGAAVNHADGSKTFPVLKEVTLTKPVADGYVIEIVLTD